jgi:hypothetical protein
MQKYKMHMKRQSEEEGKEGRCWMTYFDMGNLKGY